MTDDAWYSDLLCWCDLKEIHLARMVAQNDGDPLNILLPKVIDVTVHRVTESKAFLNLLRSAWKRSLTKSQLDAKLLEAEAIRLGVTPTCYIAEQRGTTLRAAQRLLKRANRRKMFASTPAVASIGVELAPWQPSRAAISHKLSSMTVVCAGSGSKCKGTARARYALCWDCLHEFGLPGEREPQTAAWLEPEIRRIRREAYAEAVNLLYAEHHGVTVDDPGQYDALTMAG